MPAGHAEGESQPPARQRQLGPVGHPGADSSPSCLGALPAQAREPQRAHSLFLCCHRANSGLQACTALVQRGPRQPHVTAELTNPNVQNTR